jgi:hypothetical protein
MLFILISVPLFALEQEGNVKFPCIRTDAYTRTQE